jgi:hypothetical protein
MQVRRRPGDATVFLDLDDEQITLGDDGTITITIPAALTEPEAFDGFPREGVWDLELTDADEHVTRFAQGSVTVSQDVTRDA